MGKPRTLADVDIPKVRERMRDTIERAKAEDPRELQRKISALQAELRKKPSSASPTVDKSAIDRAVERAIAMEVKRTTAVIAKVQGRVAQVLAAVTALDETLKSIPITQPARAIESLGATRAQAWDHGTAREIAKREVASNGTLAAAEQRFLTVLAQRQDKTTDRNRLAILAGYSSSSRHVDNVIAALRSHGWIEGSRGALGITGSGLEALGAWNPLPTGTALAQHWYGKLGAAPRQFLMKLVETFPDTMTRDEVALATGYSVDSRHVDNVIAELRSKDLISGTRSALLANEELVSQ